MVMTREPRAVRMIHMAVDPELVKRIEDFAWRYRFRNRSAAWRWLVEAALAAGLEPSAEEVEELRDGRGPGNRPQE